MIRLTSPLHAITLQRLPVEKVPEDARYDVFVDERAIVAIFRRYNSLENGTTIILKGGIEVEVSAAPHEVWEILRDGGQAP